MNRGYEYQDRVRPEDAGSSVIEILARRYLHSDRSEWLARLNRAEVFLDGVPADPSATPQAGQSLSWRRPPWEEPTTPLHFGILYRDQDLLAVAKPSGLPTLPGGGRYLEHTLLHQVRRRFKEASPAHRLGTGTSGVLLFGRTRLARSRLGIAFHDGDVSRVYRGLASGHPAEDRFLIDVPIGPVPHSPTGSLHAVSADGKQAATEVTVLERRQDGNSLLEILIQNGRSHQIRAHLAWAGHALVGDTLFGPEGLPLPGSVSLPSDVGYRLHAASIALRHPRSHRAIRIECAPPPELRGA